jgi:hypothetical protein
MPDPKTVSTFVYNFDVEILKRLITGVKAVGYDAVQYVATNYSMLAIVKEAENLKNFFHRDKHRLFYYSLAPHMYEWVLTVRNKALKTCIDACFFNRWVARKALIAFLGRELVEDAIANRIIVYQGPGVRFTISLVPVSELMLIRDPHYTYGYSIIHDAPPGNEPDWYRSVWLGADSVMFAKWLKNFLKGKQFEAALEIGSGSGLQMLIVAPHAKRCLAIDYDPRAVRTTALNAELNGTLGEAPRGFWAARALRHRAADNRLQL